MADSGLSRSPSNIGSPSTSRPTSRPGTPIRDSRRGPPPLPVSPSKSPPSGSPLRNSYLGYEAENSIRKIPGDHLLSGERYGSPPDFSISAFPSNVPADSSSVATLDSKIDSEELKQGFAPSSGGLEARFTLEQTAAAAKYGVHTKSASDGADVRWYFCKTPLRPNEAAAQVPASEVVGKGDYFRFSVRDSLALEASFVQREEELVSAWWKEYAEVSAGPAMSSSALSYNLQTEKETAEEKARSLSIASDGRKGPGSTHSDYDDDDGEESVGVLVKGGLYEVDLMRRRCIPVYWRGEHRRVLRGHWYVRKGGLDWLPLREDVAEQLEIAYHKKVWRRRAFQPSGLYAARVNLTGTTLGLHALFMGEDDSWEATLAVDASGISAIFGLQGSGVKLRRGFAPPDSVNPTQDELRQKKEEELDDYASQVPVRHVVFMVHGIGQRLEKANLVDDVGAFRQTVTALSEQHLTSHQRNAQRILFIPCQWRRELKLGGEVAMEQVTLDGVRALRTMITATVHDVLYYMSPVYCQDIIDSVTRSLNRLYTRFIKRNPSFDGKVSLYGHSLGSVLTYDILCHQDTLKSPFPVQNINAAIKRNDDCEEEMPKMDRLPSSIGHEFISGGANSMQDMLSPDRTDVNPTDSPANEILPDGEASAEESSAESATKTEGVVREQDKFVGIVISDEGSKFSLPSDSTNKENTGVPEVDDIFHEHTEVSEEHDIAQKHSEVTEGGIAHEYTKISEDDFALEHAKLSHEDDIAQECTEILTVDCVQEHGRILEEAKALEVKDAEQESEVVEDIDEDVKDVKENAQDVKDLEEDAKVVEKDANDVQEGSKEDAKDVKQDAQNIVQAAKDVEKDVEDVEKDLKEDAEQDVKDAKQDAKDAEQDAKDAEQDVKDAKQGVKDAEQDAEQDAKDVDEDAKDIEEDSKYVEEDVKENIKVVDKDDEEDREDEEKDVHITEQELSHDLSDANSEKEISEAASTPKIQGTEHKALHDLAAAEIERALDHVDHMMVDSAEDDEELTENERLKAKLAVLEEKVRLMENEINRRAPENFSEIRGETLDPTVSANKGSMQDSLDSAEDSTIHHCTGEDGQDLRQISPENEFGHVRENLEGSVSARKQHRPFIIYPKLKFKVETFYAVGSPLGMFLALRNIRIGLGEGTEYWEDEGIDEEMPACRLLLNIFHPYDPVAYRLEPLVCKEYVNRKPVLIPYHKGGKRIHIGLQEFGEDLGMKSKAFVNSIGAVGTRVANAFTSRKDDSITEEEEQERNRKKVKTYGQKVMERLTGSPEGRIDNMLQDATFEHQYISAISSHTSYWQDPDTALFILKHLYRDISDEPEKCDNIPTMESFRGDIDDSLDDSTDDDKAEPANNIATNSSPALSAHDDWESGDEDSGSTFWAKEEFVAAVSEQQNAKSSSIRSL